MKFRERVGEGRLRRDVAPPVEDEVGELWTEQQIDYLQRWVEEAETLNMDYAIAVLDLLRPGVVSAPRRERAKEPIFLDVSRRITKKNLLSASGRILTQFAQLLLIDPTDRSLQSQYPAEFEAVKREELKNKGARNIGRNLVWFDPSLRGQLWGEAERAYYREAVERSIQELRTTHDPYDLLRQLASMILIDPEHRPEFVFPEGVKRRIKLYIEKLFEIFCEDEGSIDFPETLFFAILAFAEEVQISVGKGMVVKLKPPTLPPAAQLPVRSTV